MILEENFITALESYGIFLFVLLKKCECDFVHVTSRLELSSYFLDDEPLSVICIYLISVLGFWSKSDYCPDGAFLLLNLDIETLTCYWSSILGATTAAKTCGHLPMHAAKVRYTQ